MQHRKNECTMFYTLKKKTFLVTLLTFVCYQAEDDVIKEGAALTALLRCLDKPEEESQGSVSDHGAT